jgi:cysteine desulfurase/selenocysteine lyase
MPDPASSDLPDVALLVRMANEMLREVPQSGIPGGMPAGTTRSLGGFGAAPPSVPLPEPPAQLVVAPAATQGSVGRPLGGLGVTLPSVPLAEVPPVDVSVPAGVPGVAGPSFSGFGVPIPSAFLPGVPPLGGTPGAVPSSANGVPTGFPVPLPGMAFPAIPPSALPPVGTVPGGGPAGIPTGTGSLGGFGAALPSAPLPEVPPSSAAVPGGGPSGAGSSLGGYGAPLPPASPPPLGTALPGGVPSGAPAGVPGGIPTGTSSLGGFGATLPSTLLPDLSAFGTGFPGEAELRALLAGTGATTSPHALPIDASPSYYFLQDATPTVPASASAASIPSDGFDVNLIRRDFPILSERVNGRPLIWLDNAATTQKPQAVIDRLSYFYQHENSNIHRAAHELAARATDAYEKARDTVRRFINASSADEIVFVRGTTEAINLVAAAWGRKFIGKDDEIVISWLEHHANIVPWKMLCEQTGAVLKVAPVDDSGQVILNQYGQLLGPRTKLVAFSQVSNALGTITPAQAMIEMAHAVGARVLLDGAQSVSHMRTDVQGLDPDWFVFSGHKVFGPTGIGALYGKPEVLAEMPPYQGGGNMIADVTFERILYQPPPGLFEAGTGNIADAVGLGAALEYVERIGIEAIGRYEHDLLVHGTRLLRDIPGLRLIGTAAEKAGVLSFVLDNVPTEAVGKSLNRDGIAVRAGHHCAQPILRRFGVETTVRPSLALYNTHADLDALAAAVRRIQAGGARTD